MMWSQSCRGNASPTENLILTCWPRCRRKLPRRRVTELPGKKEKVSIGSQHSHVVSGLIRYRANTDLISINYGHLGHVKLRCSLKICYVITYPWSHLSSENEFIRVVCFLSFFFFQSSVAKGSWIRWSNPAIILGKCQISSYEQYEKIILLLYIHWNIPMYKE